MPRSTILSPALPQQLGFVAALLLACACSDPAASTDEDPSSSESADDEDEPAYEDVAEDEDDDDQGGKLDAGRVDSGRGNPSIDSGAARDSGARDTGTTTMPSSDAGQTSDAKVTSPDSGSTSGSGQTLPPVTDYEAPGPFEAEVLENDGPGGAYTIFRPKTLGENGFKHSPITFGCGILTSPPNYIPFLTNIATHGFVVIASNSSFVGDAEVMQGLEWILEQNDTPGDYEGKLDVTRAVAMGYSIGGTAAVNAGAHPSVVTTVSIHGHTTKPALHGPLLQTTGTNDTSGVPLQQGTYDQSEVQTFMATLQNASHFEILGGEDLQDITQALSGDGDGGREVGPIIAWLRYWVYGDQGAKHFFYGDDCVLCKDPWTNPQRKNWPDE